MKLQGQRQSKNVEDITKQKKKFDISRSAYDYPQWNVKKGDLVKARTQVSKTPVKDTGPVRTDIGNKAGLSSMEKSVETDRATRAANPSIDDMLDKAFSKENTSKAPAGYNKLSKAEAPTQLNEIWTPRPHK